MLEARIVAAKIQRPEDLVHSVAVAPARMIPSSHGDGANVVILRGDWWGSVAKRYVGIEKQRKRR
jgi:hypothetical protein